MPTIEEVWELVNKTYKGIATKLKNEFFVAQKPHPCKKGIYYYLHECNFPKLLSEIITASETKVNVLTLWISTVLQIFGIEISPKIFT